MKEYRDQIDLYDLWKIIASRKKFVVLFFIIAVVASAAISLLIPKTYRGEVLLNVIGYDATEIGELPVKKEIIDAREIVDMIGNFDREKKAMIFPTTYRAVTDLNIRPLRESKNKLMVSIDGADRNAIPKALSELMDYLNSIEIVKTTVKDEKEKLLKRSSELSALIDSSSDLASTYRKLLKDGRLLPVGFNPLDLNKKIADVKIEKLRVDQSIMRFQSGGIEIARQLYIHKDPVKPVVMLNIAIAGAAGIFCAILLALFADYVSFKKGS